MATPITEKFLGQRDLFGIEWDQGYTFHEVMDWERVEFEPYEGLEDVEAGTSLDDRFQRLEDDAGDDILHVPKDNHRRILHAAIGHRPVSLRRYTFFPENQSKVGKFPNLSSPSPGDNYGYVDGEDSPYEQPTDAEEMVMPPGVRASFDFHNPTGIDHFPVLHILGRVYTVRNLDPGDSRDQPQIERIASPGSPMPLYSVGTTRAKAEFDLGGRWEEEPISLNQARNATNNRSSRGSSSGRGRGR